jgi:hypothetical protein
MFNSIQIEMIRHTQCCLHVKGTVGRDFNLVSHSPNFKLISNPSPKGADNFGYTVLKLFKTSRNSRRAKNFSMFESIVIWFYRVLPIQYQLVLEPMDSRKKLENSN